MSANLTARKITKPVPVITEAPSSVKETEIRTSLFTCCHGIFQSADHLGELLQKEGRGSVFEKIKLHRTKCTQIIKKVIDPSLKEQLKGEIAKRNKKFSVLIDESSDHHMIPHLAVIIRHYSSTIREMADDCVALIALENTTSAAIFKAVSECLSDMGLSWSDCTSYASDGANNVAGRNNGVYAKVNAENNHIIQFKCMAHSLALCVKYSFEKNIPDEVDYLLTKIPLHFKLSHVRRAEYANVQDLIEDDPSEKPYDSIADTRWLSRGKVTRSIKNNWESLKTYFSSLKLSNFTPSQAHDLKLIAKYLQSDANYLYLQFLSPVIDQFEKANRLFQTSSADEADKAYTELATLYKLYHDKVFKPNPMNQSMEKEKPKKALKGISEIHCSIIFDREYKAKLENLNKIKAHFVACANDSTSTFNTAKDIAANEEKLAEIEKNIKDVIDVKSKIRNFLVYLVYQLEERLPQDEGQFYKKLKCFSPQSIFKGGVISDLPLLETVPDEQLPQLEEEWDRLKLQHFDEEVMKYPLVKFWSYIKETTIKEGELLVLKYPNLQLLADFALGVLTLAHSTASVERIFSMVAAIRTKIRNRMALESLQAVLRIRAYVKNRNMCCTSLPITKSMIDRLNSKMYDDSGRSKEANDEEDEAMLLMADLPPEEGHD